MVREKSECVNMETKFKLGIAPKSHSGVTARLGVLLRKATQIRLLASRETLPVDMFNSDCVPYEVSRTYREIMAEFNCRRAQTSIEVQRNLLRGF